MAITSSGYDGSVDEEAWQRLILMSSGLMYNVGNGVSSCRPSIGGAGDRAVTIASGLLYGRGVADVVDAAVVKNHSSVASGSRWDMGVLRRNYGSNTSSFEIVTGGSTKALPSRSTGYPVDDQPIYLARIQAGQAAVQELVDLRVHQYGGGYVAYDDLALAYNTTLGVSVTIEGVVWRLIVKGGVATWVRDAPQPRWWTSLNQDNRWWAAETWGNMQTITIPDAPAGDYMLTGNAVVKRLSGTPDAHGLQKRFVVNGQQIAPEVQDDIVGNVWADRALTWPHLHAGGALSVSFSIKAGIGDLSVKSARTTVCYLGPRS